MNLINLAIKSEETGIPESNIGKQQLEQESLKGIEENKFDPDDNKFTFNKETSNFKIENQQEPLGKQTDSNQCEVEEEESERFFNRNPSTFEPEKSNSSMSNSLAGKKMNKFSRRLEELKRQQAKLDKIKSEKDQLQAYLQYQAEIEAEKERKRQQEIAKLEELYNQKAVIIQKYARVWLAKRYVAQLQEEEFRRQKEMLNQALEEMRDQIRV